ncbi:hypothetical protein AMTRI_Chr01g110990 [Amborella trichopoda]
MEGQRRKRSAGSWLSTSRFDLDGNGGEGKEMVMTRPCSTTNTINNPNPSDEEVEVFFAILRHLSSKTSIAPPKNHFGTLPLSGNTLQLIAVWRPQ